MLKYYYAFFWKNDIKLKTISNLFDLLVLEHVEDIGLSNKDYNIGVPLYVCGEGIILSLG